MKKTLILLPVISLCLTSFGQTVRADERSSDAIVYSVAGCAVGTMAGGLIGGIATDSPQSAKVFSIAGCAAGATAGIMQSAAASERAPAQEEIKQMNEEAQEQSE